MTGPIARPSQLRGLAARSAIKGGALSLVVTTIICHAYWRFHMVPIREKAMNYLKNTDPYKLMEDMCKKNALSSCPQNRIKK